MVSPPSSLTEIPPERETHTGPAPVRVRCSGVARDYASALLRDLGITAERKPATERVHPVIRWARSGAMALTGRPGRPPLVAPGPLADCAEGALDALRGVARSEWRGPTDGAALLGERAALAGLVRRGTTAPGGSCRLLPAADGWIAVSLARADDLRLLPAWLGEGDTSEPWRFVADRVSRRTGHEAVARARLLGLPAAAADPVDPTPPPWYRIGARGPALPRPRRAPPLVLDLSSLWAGPLCTHLLGAAGARVVKVESSGRPDGARFGPARFFDLLNAGKKSVALDLRSTAGRASLVSLLERADIVVESARPRALQQLGIDASSLVERTPGLTWVSITGYGRRDPFGSWVAFGDDAAVAAGLATATGRGRGGPLFCGDAIADPLTGIHAALAALATWTRGRGLLLDLSLRDVTAHALGFGSPLEVGRCTVSRSAGGLRTDHEGSSEVRTDPAPWEIRIDGERADVAVPRARVPTGRARPLGADTEAVLREPADPVPGLRAKNGAPC